MVAVSRPGQAVDRPAHEWHRRTRLFDHEIEIGRSVPANWDDYLVETWAQRKARLARERYERERGWRP